MKRNYARPVAEVKSARIRASLLAGSLYSAPRVAGTPAISNSRNAVPDGQLVRERSSFD